MKGLTKIPWLDILTALLLYAIVLIYQGYQYGQGDQSQILPCLYAQDHPETYANDHYVSSYLAGQVNERTIFHFLLRYLGYNQPWLVWFWHLLLTTSLFMAWLKIASLGITHKVYQFLTVASIFILGFLTSVGSNELYYNMLIPSLAAKSLASWALYYWLKEKYPLWIVFLVIAGYLQPLVSVQLFIITSISSVVQFGVQKKSKNIPWRSIAAYLFMTLPWLFLLFRNNGSADDPAGFMDIMEFRLSHHFFPGAFGWFHILVFCILVIITIRFYKMRLKWFMLTIILGCIVYTFGVESYRQPLALYTQWWKSTIWLEAFAFIAIAVTLEKGSPSPKIFTKYKMVVPLTILLLVGVYRMSGWFGNKPDYMLPWLTLKSDEVDISEQALALTPENAVFIVPVEFSTFRWYSKRSLYVDYKALFHQEQFLHEWFKRIEQIYAYGLKERKGGFDIHVFSKSLLEEPTLISTDYWRNLGITHIVSTSPNIKSLKLISSNSSYSIYSLK
ncbi:MAG: DUF6798 domain-containing protein [Saprospiraceae bacterium]|nr:DUF6798 domain-containing protein [Saprospiraceae bacterium]